MLLTSRYKFDVNFPFSGYYSVASNPILLYSTASDIRVANLSRIGKANAIVKGLEQGSAVDFIHRSNLICWSDQTAELIQCMNYNETYSGEKVSIPNSQFVYFLNGVTISVHPTH